MSSQRQQPGTGGGPSVGRQVAGSIPASAINDSLAGPSTDTAAYVKTDGAAAPEWRKGEWLVDVDDTKLGEILEDHQNAGMDFIALVSDYFARRGTGKSTLSLAGARWSDTTEEGVGPEKVTQSPEEFIDAYAHQPGGSGLVFDEAEAGANARDSMQKINKLLNERVAIGRVGEKYSWINMPDVSQIDKQLRKMAHIWILVTRRGRARVYKFQNNPFENKVYPEAICEVDWAKIPKSDPAMRKLNEAKWDKLKGDEGTKHVPIDEHKEKLQKARKEERRKARNEYIVGCLKTDLLPQHELEGIFDLSQSQISNIWKDYKNDRLEVDV